MKKLLLIPMIATLASCQATRPPQQINYQNFIAPKRIVTEKIAVHLPEPKVNATFNLGEDPKVVKAYKEYSKNGIAKNIAGKGINIMAYNPYEQFMVQCSPLHLCVLQLEQGEKINNIDVGDSINWLVSTSSVGTAETGSYQITIKPKSIELATDMVITTTKRTYNVGLISREGATTRIMSFYYPEDTLKKSLQNLENNNHSNEVITASPNINLDKVNFHYDIAAERYAICPDRIFDDGVHTLIEMPQDIEQNNLPVLYLENNGKTELVNYRYKHPYYVIDSVIQRAALISSNNKKVIITRMS